MGCFYPQTAELGKPNERPFLASVHPCMLAHLRFWLINLGFAGFASVYFTVSVAEPFIQGPSRDFFGWMKANAERMGQPQSVVGFKGDRGSS